MKLKIDFLEPKIEEFFSPDLSLMTKTIYGVIVNIQIIEANQLVITLHPDIQIYLTSQQADILDKLKMHWFEPATFVCFVENEKLYCSTIILDDIISTAIN